MYLHIRPVLEYSYGNICNNPKPGPIQVPIYSSKDKGSIVIKWNITQQLK